MLNTKKFFLDRQTLSYVNNGVLNMLDRNRRIKERPQRFQESKDRFHVVISLEERVYDQIMEGNF